MSATMIDFSCAKCGTQFTVPANYAKRRARCKSCGGEITVPAATTSSEPTSSASSSATDAPRLSPRARRLLADAEQINKVFENFGTIHVIEVRGSPPDTYRIGFRISGLAPGKKPDQPVPCERHEAEIQLPADYPRSKPLCRMLTPVFHPNIDPSVICVGDHWTAGERLVDLVVRIGEMLAYQAYNLKSPLDAHAAMWADLNAEKLPIDRRSLHPAGL
jgi:ubiquitin-protein ligase/DNA-directed RNA polymerase subunit RPC12/RpoP